MAEFNGHDGEVIRIVESGDAVAIDVDVPLMGNAASISLDKEIAQYAAMEMLKVSGAQMTQVNGPSTVNVIPDDAPEEELLAVLLERLAKAAHEAGHDDLKAGLSFLGLGLVAAFDQPWVKSVIRALVGVPLDDQKQAA